MSIQSNQLGDLIAATLNDLGEMKLTDITTDLQQHIAMRSLLKKNRITLESGAAIQWDLMVTTSGAAKVVALYGADNVNVGETLIQGKEDWKHVTTNYAVDEREIAMNRSPRRIIDLLKTRRYDAMVSLAELLESQFWQFPSATDNLSWHGVPYWVVKNATAGFNGGAQAGYTTVGGVNPSTYPRWKNWTNGYTSITKDDLIRKWREAATKTVFLPPVEGLPTFNTGDQYGFYTNYAVVGQLEETLEAQNDNLGKDIASQDGQVVFRRTPVLWVPKLDLDTTNPVYGLNWGEFKTYLLRGWWLNETKITNQPGQHNVSVVHVDSTGNWICKNRRRNFVLSNGTTYPF